MAASDPVLELEVLPILGWVEFGVVLLDEAAGAADQIQSHEVAPVVSVLAFLECRERPDWALVSADEFGLSQLPKKPLRPDADVPGLVNE